MSLWARLGNASIAAAGTGRLPGGKLESIFLFVGILSGRGYRHRRLAGNFSGLLRCLQIEILEAHRWAVPGGLCRLSGLLPWRC